MSDLISSQPAILFNKLPAKPSDGLPPTSHVPGEGFTTITELLNHDAHLKIVMLSGQNAKIHDRRARALGAAASAPAPAVSAEDLQVDCEKIARFQLEERNFKFDQAMTMWEENYINTALGIC